MGGERCWRCGLRRLEAEERCIGCGAAFDPAPSCRRHAGGGKARILLGPAAVLAAKERLAPAGRLFNITRFFLGAASGFLLLLWAYAAILISLYLAAPWILVYCALFALYPAAALYCCVRVLPARKVAALGALAHLAPPLGVLVVYAFYGERAGGSTFFGWAVTLSFIAAWVALYAARLMDEGRLRTHAATQTALGVALIALTVVALVWSHHYDERARRREIELRMQQWSDRR